MWVAEYALNERHRSRILIASAVFATIIALTDWLTKPYWSLGFLYLFPIMLAAAYLPRWAVVTFAFVCALLSELFSSLNPAEAWLRIGFVSMALIGSGLFVSELINKRRLSLEAQERLRIFVETSPAAIVTISDHGIIEMANRAATDLFAPRDGGLVGQPIAAFLPELHYALRREEGPQFRASMQCRGHRDDGRSFLADIWFSTYKENNKPKLAAIIAETPPESDNSTFVNPLLSESALLTDRETDVMRLLVQGLTNKEIGARLDISESSVKNTLQSIFAKTGVRTRSQLVRVALENYRDRL